jgi:hypothetical protein
MLMVKDMSFFAICKSSYSTNMVDHVLSLGIPVVDMPFRFCYWNLAVKLVNISA